MRDQAVDFRKRVRDGTAGYSGRQSLSGGWHLQYFGVAIQFGKQLQTLLRGVENHFTQPRRCPGRIEALDVYPFAVVAEQEHLFGRQLVSGSGAALHNHERSALFAAGIETPHFEVCISIGDSAHKSLVLHVARFPKPIRHRKD